MSWMIDNFGVIVGLIAIVCVAAMSVYGFFMMKSDAQMEKVKEWLKFAVAEAEKELGSGTGQLKLRMVYDLFVQRFQWLAKVITFMQFASMVDEALDWLKVQLDTNKNIKELVNESN